MDRWKATTVVLAGVFALVVQGRFVREVDAQPVRIGGPEAAPAPAPPGEAPPDKDRKKAPPSQKALKILEHARTTLRKAPKDADGHRDKALALINQAVEATAAIPVPAEAP